MDQTNPNQYNPAQFIVEYYTTYAYKRNEIFKFYEKMAAIYRQEWHTNISLNIQQCSDSLFFSKEGDHITVLNYATLPLQFGFLFVINGRIDTTDGRQMFFNQVLQNRYFGFYQLIVADYFAITGPPQWILPQTEYYDVYPPNATSNDVSTVPEIPKQDEAVNNQSEPSKQQVTQIQQQQQPTQQQQQNDYPINNGGRGRENNYRYPKYNYQRGGRGQSRNDNGSKDLSEKYGSSNKYTYNSQSKYIPPNQKS